MSKSSIEWTEHTWNPVRGCSRVSEGCRNCYAERFAARFGKAKSCGAPAKSPAGGYQGFVKLTPEGPRWTGKVELIPSMLLIPLKRKKPTTYFVNSMSDLFHEDLPDEAIDRIFAVMALCPQHRFQILTKRAARMEQYCNARAGQIADAIIKLRRERGDDGVVLPVPSLDPVAVWWPLPWVWLGVSVEDQETADERIPHLLRTPAAVRFVSYEPALAAIDFSRYLDPAEFGYNEPLTLDWLIVGGESGPGARPFDIAWARWTLAQCKAAGVRCFVKQVGSKPIDPEHHCAIDCGCGLHHGFRDRKGGTMAEWPNDVRVRETPQ